MVSADNFKPKRLKKQFQAVTGAKRAKNIGTVAAVAAVHAPTRRNDLQPVMATVMRPIYELKPAPHRARIGTPELRASLLNSVKRYGMLEPILIDKQDQIIAGHELWEVAKQLGIGTIECRVVEHLDPLECEAASIALNRCQTASKRDPRSASKRDPLAEGVGRSSGALFALLAA